jgi:hypothetical protein
LLKYKTNRKGLFILKCWFCEQNISEGEHDISLGFERFNYADKLAQKSGEQPDKLKHDLIVSRCSSCFESHKKYNYISLYSLIPFTIMAVSLFLLFRDVNEIIVFTLLALSMIGLGIIVAVRWRFLSKKGIKALIEMEMKNEDIRAMLANGWYRK